MDYELIYNYSQTQKKLIQMNRVGERLLGGERYLKEAAKKRIIYLEELIDIKQKFINELISQGINHRGFQPTTYLIDAGDLDLKKNKTKKGSVENE